MTATPRGGRNDGFLVLPVSALNAWAWARGRLSDAELLQLTDLVNPCYQSIWVCSIRGTWQWRPLLQMCRAWSNPMSVVARTKNPVIERYLFRAGAMPISEEADGCRRWWGGEDRVKAWLNSSGRAGWQRIPGPPPASPLPGNGETTSPPSAPPSAP